MTLSNDPRAERRASLSGWVQMIGALGAILYGVVGATEGLSQQRGGAAAPDCEYRVLLLRDRVVATLERSHHPKLQLNPSNDELSTLIRETQAACAEASTSAERLAVVRDAYEQFVRHDEIEAAARRRLRAF